MHAQSQTNTRQSGVNEDNQGNLDVFPPPPPSSSEAAQGAKRNRRRNKNNSEQEDEIAFSSSSGITPSMSNVVETPSNFKFTASPSFSRTSGQIDYSSSGFWGSTKNAAQKSKRQSVKSDSEGIRTGGNSRGGFSTKRPLSAKGRQIFFSHISGSGSSVSANASAASSISSSGGGSSRRKNGGNYTAAAGGSNGKAGGGGGGGTSSNKAIVMKTAKEKAKIAHKSTLIRRCKCKKSKVSSELFWARR